MFDAGAGGFVKIGKRGWGFSVFDTWKRILELALEYLDYRENLSRALLVYVVVGRR